MAPRRCSGTERAAPHALRVLAKRLGVEAADRRGDDGDASLAPFLRELTGEPLDRGARRARVHHRRHPVMRRDRDVDDRPSGGPEAVLHDGARHLHRPVDVQPHDGPPPLCRDVLRRDEVLAARVVDQHVQPPVALHGRLDDALCVRRLADVTGNDGAALADLLGGSLENLGAATGDHDRPSAGDDLERRRLPQVRPATGDQDDPSRERTGGEDLRGRRHP